MAIEHELDRIKALLVRLGAALERLELDEAVALMTADVIILGWVGPPVVGRPAVREHYERLLSAFAMTVSRSDVDVEILGDVAVISCSETGTIRPRRGGRSIHLLGRLILVCRKDAGTWRVARAMSVLTGRNRLGSLPITTHRSELLRRAQSRPGTIISEVA